MIRYKLTTQDYTTYNGTKWEVGKEVKAIGLGKQLCTSDVIHFYDHPLLAVLLNPIHANIYNPLLWEIEIDKVVAHDGLKGGCKSATPIRQIDLPIISKIQKIAFAILCAKQIYKNKKWNTWADNWLNNTDRTKQSAASATYAAATSAYTDAAAAAATSASTAAAYAAAASATYAAATSAYTDAAAATATSAYAAAYAAATSAAAARNNKINFVKIALQAMEVK